MPESWELKIRQDMIEVGRRLYNLGFVAANDGNISVRIGPNEILTTPHGVSKGFMDPSMICKVDLTGRVLAGDRGPSSELLMHLAVYQNRSDVGAIVHAHPPTATAFAVAGLAPDSNILPEVIINLGTVPLCPYGTPSTNEVPDSIRPYLAGHDAFLLANHGALTIGKDLFNAYYKMESLEHYAKVALIARQLGGGRQLTTQQVEKLIEVSKKM